MLSRDNGQRGFSVEDAMNFGVSEAIFVRHLCNELNTAFMLSQNEMVEGRFELVI